MPAGLCTLVPCSCGAISASSTCLLPTPRRSRSCPSSLPATRSTSALWTSPALLRPRVSPSVRPPVLLSMKLDRPSLTLRYHRPAQPPGHDHLRHPVKGCSLPRTLRLIRSLGCIYLTPSALVTLGLCSLLNFTLSSVSDVALVGSIHKWGSHFVIISRRASVKDLPYTVHVGAWSKVSRTRGTVVTLRPPHGVLPHHVRPDNRRCNGVPYTDNK